MVMTIKHIQKKIPVSSLVVDDENPRFFHLRMVGGRKKINQSELLAEIGKDTDIKYLIRSIKQEGVQDPIWVKPIKGGMYKVIEGNRRTYVLKNLCDRGETPPNDVEYNKVIANVVDETVSDARLLILKITLQTGKKSWRAFNEAAASYKLSKTFHMANEDIANVDSISVKEVERRIENFEMFQEYIKSIGTMEISKFSFFADIPSKTRKWVREKEKNKQDYFKLITPDEYGIQRLRSVATKGGVRDFGKLLDDPRVLSAFIKDDLMTMETALELVKDLDIWKKYNWLKTAEKLVTHLRLLEEQDLKKIAYQKQAVKILKRLSVAVVFVLEKLKEFDND